MKVPVKRTVTIASLGNIIVNNNQFEKIGLDSKKKLIYTYTADGSFVIDTIIKKYYSYPKGNFSYDNFLNFAGMQGQNPVYLQRLHPPIEGNSNASKYSQSYHLIIYNQNSSQILSNLTIRKYIPPPDITFDNHSNYSYIIAHTIMGQDDKSQSFLLVLDEFNNKVDVINLTHSYVGKVVLDLNNQKFALYNDDKSNSSGVIQLDDITNKVINDVRILSNTSRFNYIYPNSLLSIPNETLLYIGQSKNKTNIINIMNTTSNKIESTILLGLIQPSIIRFDPTNKLLYTCGKNGIAIIDQNTNTILKKIGIDSNDCDVDSDKGILYASSMKDYNNPEEPYKGIYILSIRAK